MKAQVSDLGLRRSRIVPPDQDAFLRLFPRRSTDGPGLFFAVAVGEHPVVAPVDADRGEVGGLVGQPAREHGAGRVVELDGTAGGLGLVRVWWTS